MVLLDEDERTKSRKVGMTLNDIEAKGGNHILKIEVSNDGKSKNGVQHLYFPIWRTWTVVTSVPKLAPFANWSSDLFFSAFFPQADWVKRLKSTMLSVAPENMTQIFPMMCGSCSNENGIKLIFLRFMDKQRGGRTELNQEELETTMTNSPPGTPKICMLTFKGGFHGRTIGLLSCSNSRPIHGVDIPAFGWPKCDFPRYKYPLEENERDNQAEDKRCLAMAEEMIEKQTKIGVPVAGILTEPIQGEGGDRFGSKDFFQGLEKICKKYDISFMFDEVQTGGGSTGKMWCHQHFELEDGPDIMTFSKKMISGGVFHKKSHAPQVGGRIQNTWVGDPHKMILLQEVVKTIKSENLLDLQVQSGAVLLNGLRDMEKRFPGLFHASRGLGTFCSVDMPTEAIRNEFVEKAKQSGLLIGGCGDSTVRFRPSLVAEPKHMEIAVDVMNKVASTFE